MQQKWDNLETLENKASPQNLPVQKLLIKKKKEDEP